jgi:mannan endo-1,4-beta-mannosidase
VSFTYTLIPGVTTTRGALKYLPFSRHSCKSILLTHLQWIIQHDVLGAKSKKPVILEEYGAPFPNNHTAVEGPWQQTVLKETKLAADQIWQFGPNGTVVDAESLGDVNSIYFGNAEYQILGVKHAKDMLAKKV